MNLQRAAKQRLGAIGNVGVRDPKDEPPNQKGKGYKPFRVRKNRHPDSSLYGKKRTNESSFRVEKYGPKAKEKDTVNWTYKSGEKAPTWNINGTPVGYTKGRSNTNPKNTRYLGKKWGVGIEKDRLQKQRDMSRREHEVIRSKNLAVSRVKKRSMITEKARRGGKTGGRSGSWG